MIIVYWKDRMLKSRIKVHALASSIDIKFAKNLEELKTYIESATIKRIIVDLTAGPEFANSFAAILNQGVESWGVIAHRPRYTRSSSSSWLY